MWMVFNIKLNNLKIFTKSLSEKIHSSHLETYMPKILTEKWSKGKKLYSEKLLLGKYVFCYDEKFKNQKYLNNIKFTKGLNYILNNRESDQNDIKNFINTCKKYESKKGYLRQEFFKQIDLKKGFFLNGPMKNLFFEIINSEKNRVKIRIGDLNVVSSNKNNYAFLPI